MPEESSLKKSIEQVSDTEQKGKNVSNENPMSSQPSAPIATTKDSDSSLQAHKTKTYRVRCPDCHTVLATGQTEEQAKHLLQVHQVSCSAKDNGDTETEDKTEDKHVEQFVNTFLKFFAIGLLAIISGIAVVKGIQHYKNKMKELDDKEKEGLK